MNVHRRHHAALGIAAGDRAAQFGGTEKISVANDGTFSPENGTDLTLVYWFSVDELPPSGVWEMVNVSGNAVALDGWFTFVDSSGGLAMGYSNGTGYHSISSLPTIVIQVDTWYMGVFRWNNDASPGFELAVYNTAGFMNSFSNAAGGFINRADPQPMNIGGGTAGQQWSKSRIDKVGFWERSLNGLEAGLLHNGGEGLTGAQVAESAFADFVDYYDLDQATGSSTWASFLGTHNGTATGTVVSVPPAGQF